MCHQIAALFDQKEKHDFFYFGKIKHQLDRDVCILERITENSHFRSWRLAGIVSPGTILGNACMNKNMYKCLSVDYNVYCIMQYHIATLHKHL